MKKHPILTVFLVLAGLFVFGIIAVSVLSVMKGNEAFLTEPVAVEKIEGPIFESLDTLKKLKALENNKSVKVVILRLNSPGGAVAPSEEIYEQVLNLKKKKKVIVSMGTVAASGAYYIAAAADKIVASGGTITGSIGVIMESFGLKRVADKFLLEPRTIKSGEFKDVGNPFRDMTESEREYLQNILDDSYEQFIQAVSQGRNIPLEKMPTVAEGRVYTGRQAKEIGLVDDIGNIYKAIELGKKLAGLPESAKVRWPKEPTAFEKFVSGESAANLSIDKILSRYKRHLPLWLMPDALGLNSI